MQMIRDLIRPLLVISALAALVFGLTACSSEEHGALVEGEPVELGELEYEVQFTRILNIHDVEDREYLVGKPAPSPDKSYIGVFVTIKNLSDSESIKVPSDFHVVDTDGNVFRPLESESVYALHFGDEIGPGDVVPALDSTAQVGPISGSLILFEITDQATANRPLELVIPGPDEEARVVLDV